MSAPLSQLSSRNLSERNLSKNDNVRYGLGQCIAAMVAAGQGWSLIPDVIALAESFARVHISVAVVGWVTFYLVYQDSYAAVPVFDCSLQTRHRNGRQNMHKMAVRHYGTTQLSRVQCDK